MSSERASPEMSDHDQKILEMQKETSQDSAVCQFYLESTNWNVREAISLFQSMS